MSLYIRGSTIYMHQNKFNLTMYACNNNDGTTVMVGLGDSKNLLSQ